MIAINLKKKKKRYVNCFSLPTVKKSRSVMPNSNKNDSG